MACALVQFHKISLKIFSGKTAPMIQAKCVLANAENAFYTTFRVKAGENDNT